MPAAPECRRCNRPVEAAAARRACPVCLSWYHTACQGSGCYGCPAGRTRRGALHEIEVVDEGHELKLVSPPRRFDAVVIAALAILPLGLGAICVLRVDPGDSPLLLGALSVVCLGAGAAMVYAALVALVNRLEVRASRVRIEVVEGPLPWRGSTTVSLAGLEQLYVQPLLEDRHRLVAIHRGRAVRLLELVDAESLRFIERELEQWLGLDDLPVEGEAPREHTPLACPACGHTLGRGVRKAACNTCFAWHHAACWRKERGCAACRRGSPVAPAKLPVPSPGGIDVQGDEDELVIAFAWKDVRPPKLWVVFTALALPLMFIGLDIALPAMPSSTRLIHVILSPLVAWVVYFYVAGHLNRTTIRLTPRELTLHHGPLPWKGVTLPVARIERIAREVHTVSGEDGPVDAFYELVALLKGGGRVQLVRFISDRAQVDFLVGELEARLRAKP